MNKLIIIIIAFLLSCKGQPAKEKRTNFIEGKWIVLYPDHARMEEEARKIYGEIQDSIVELRGLKLLRFDRDGKFSQADSFNRPGYWKISMERDLLVEKGGAGFSPFNIALLEDNDSLVILTEMVKYKGMSLRLDWNLKRLEDDDESFFFAEKNNKWRIKPVRSESPKELKEKLQTMLDYYSKYYYLVNRESTYFIPSRVLLPFKFYQHAVGLRPLASANYFEKLFYNTAQAEEAHGYLDSAMESLRNQFPAEGDNFVKEYADFLRMLAEKMEEMIKE